MFYTYVYFIITKFQHCKIYFSKLKLRFIWHFLISIEIVLLVITLLRFCVQNRLSYTDNLGYERTFMFEIYIFVSS